MKEMCSIAHKAEGAGFDPLATLEISLRFFLCFLTTDMLYSEFYNYR